MTTPTDTERKEIEARIKAAQPLCSFEHPLPEIFVSAERGRMNVTYHEAGCKMMPGIAMQVLLPHVPLDGGPVFIYVLGNFRLN